MELILKENVEHLGEKNDIVKVKDGYGRNFLIPTGKAVLATPSAKKVLEENLRQQKYKLEKILEEAKTTAAQLEGKVFKIAAKAGESGKIFGSVTNIQAAEALKNAGFNVERKSIIFKADSIKNVGQFEATVRLHKDVSVVVTFDVVAE